MTPATTSTTPAVTGELLTQLRTTSSCSRSVRHPTERDLGSADRWWRQTRTCSSLAGMATYDLVITNGIVVDGTGLPRRRADVGVKDGRIAAIGFIDASEGDRVIDAEGRVVAPGIV